MNIIIGGGVAGLTVARELERTGEEVVLVVEKDYYISGPSRPLILSKEQTIDRIIRGYNHLPDKIKVIFGKVTKIVPEENKVIMNNNKELEYSNLVIATGIKYNYDALESGDKVYNVYDIGKLFDLRELVWKINKGTILINAPRQPYRCAPAPGETAMIIDMILRYRKVRDKVKIIFVDANPKFQPPVIHDVWKTLFEEASIEYYTNAEIAKIDKEGVELSDGTRIKADYKVILPPNIGVSPFGLGYLEVRSPFDLRLKNHDNIYAVGDIAKLPFPKNAEIASISATIAARQILGEKINIKYHFIGWAYTGNLDGVLETKSVQFELEFTEEGPKGKKDPEPKEEYTRKKDIWEQAMLKKLFGY